MNLSHSAKDNPLIPFTQRRPKGRQDQNTHSRVTSACSSNAQSSIRSVDQLPMCRCSPKGYILYPINNKATSDMFTTGTQRPLIIFLMRSVI